MPDADIDKSAAQISRDRCSTLEACMMSMVKTIARKVRSILKKDPDAFLEGVKGVIHVGANIGQERDRYHKYGLNVLWIEPIPAVFAQLRSNIQRYPEQLALQYLVADKNGVEREFHIASNMGASSSMLDFKHHKDLWPDVAYEDHITLCSFTLPAILEKECIDADQYNVLIIDTQGTELLVLKGAEALLKNFLYIKTEAPDFESYAGCCQVGEVSEFLNRHGFAEFSRTKFAGRKGFGNYYDIVYKRDIDAR